MLFGKSEKSAREWKDQAAALQAKGKLDGALDAYRKAAGLEPQDATARRKAEAITEYQAVVGVHASHGQSVQAIAICKLILQLDPARRETLDTLAGLYSSRKDKSSWIESMPAAMAGAMNLAHVKRAPQQAEASVEVEVEIEVEVGIDEVAPAPFFSDLPREALQWLLERLELREIPEGTAVVREGEAGHSMFIVAQGKVNVVRHHGQSGEKVVASMGEGTFFGEIGVLADVPRLATVVAAKEASVLEVTREALEELRARFPASQGVMERFFKERLLANLLRSSPVFQTLSTDSAQALVESFQLRKAGAGELLLQEGEAGKGLFVLLRGRCDAYHLDAAGKEKAYPAMGEGALFGEISLLRGGKVTANVRAAEPCLLLFLPREAFERHLLTNPAAAESIAQLGEARLERTEAMRESERQERAALLV